MITRTTLLTTSEKSADFRVNGLAGLHVTLLDIDSCRQSYLTYFCRIKSLLQKMSVGQVKMKQQERPEEVLQRA